MLKPHQAAIVKRGLMAQMTEEFRHPDYFPNQFDGIWIDDGQKRAYLRRLSEKGLVRCAYHERGWYKCNTYAALRPGDENYNVVQIIIGQLDELPF